MQLRLAQHVNEAGRDNFSGGVDGSLARGVGEMADSGDFSVTNADIAGVPRGTGAVDDLAVGDDEVKGLRSLGNEWRCDQ